MKMKLKTIAIEKNKLLLAQKVGELEFAMAELMCEEDKAEAVEWDQEVKQLEKTCKNSRAKPQLSSELREVREDVEALDGQLLEVKKATQPGLERGSDAGAALTWSKNSDEGLEPSAFVSELYDEFGSGGLEFDDLRPEQLEGGDNIIFARLPPSRRREIIFQSKLAMTSCEKRIPVSSKTGVGARHRRPTV